MIFNYACTLALRSMSQIHSRKPRPYDRSTEILFLGGIAVSLRLRVGLEVVSIGCEVVGLKKTLVLDNVVM